MVSSSIPIWNSLKIRVTVLTLVIFLISVWSLAFYSSRMLREDMTAQLGSQQLSVAKVAAANVNQAFKDRLSALEQLAKLASSPMQVGSAAVQVLLEQQPVLQNLFNGGIVAYGKDGTVFADSLPATGRIGANYIEIDTVKASITEGRTTIGRPVVGKKLNRPLISMGAAIRDERGEVIGGIAGLINLGLPNFLDLITENTYGKTGGYLIVAPQYRLIVTATDKNRIMEALPPPGINSAIDRFLDGFEGYAVIINARGVVQLTASAGIPVAGWAMGAVMPAEEAFAPIRDMERRIILATVFLTLMAGGLTWWMLQRQLSPMLVAARALATQSDPDQPPQPLPVARNDEIGQLVGGFNHLLEVLEQRKWSLQESEIRHRTLFEATADAVLILDENGFLDCNLAAIRMYGASGRAEILARHPSELSPPTQQDGQDSRELADRSIARAMEAGHLSFEWLHLRLDTKAVFLADVLLSAMKIGGRQVLLATVRDITERKRDEEELRRHKDHLEELVQDRTRSLETAVHQAQAANRAKSAFLANMSHELRTPLTSVIGFSQMLAEDPEMKPAQRHKLGLINRSGNHLLTLINEVLELSKIEAGGMRLETQRVNPGALIDGVAEMLRPRAAQKGLTLTVRSTGLPAGIVVDTGKLRQILLNLLSNAVKFTRHGDVMLAVNGTLSDPGWVRLDFAVSDTGVGIAAEDREAIFAPFVQVGTANDQAGTGLGLSISHQFVRLMGGEITLESELGRGSSFRFSLCLETCEPLEAMDPAPGRVIGLEGGAGGQRILVVEDTPNTKLLLRGLLTPLGFEVVEAEDGAVAVGSVAAWPPDLVIMDWRMPEMDGLEATKRIRAMTGIAQPKIIMLTATAFEEDRQLAMTAGVDDFLRKPFERNVLLTLLERHLGIRFRREDAEDTSGRPISAKEMTEQDLSVLSQDLRGALVVALQEMNPVKIAEVLERYDREHPDLANRIRAMLDGGRYIDLHRLLKG